MAGRRAEGSDWERRLVDVHDAAERVVAAQTRDRDLVEDLAQETVARVVEASPRLADEALVPYAVVTARNLFLSAMRDERRRREGAHRIVERTEQTRPEEHILEQERHGALYEALERLGVDERRTVLAHEVAEVDTRRLAEGHGTSPGAVAVRLAGIRAKLRVEYLLSFRNVELPTDRCRSLLVALSAGDRRRQEALRTGDHLLRCPTCASLSEALLRRDRALAAWWPVALVVPAAKLLGRSVKSHPTATAASVTVAAGLAVGGTFLLADEPRPEAPAVAVTVAAAAPAAPAPSTIEVRGQPVLPIRPGEDLRRYAGRAVDVRGAMVLSVDSDEGFWVGEDDAGRVWVQLSTEGESPTEVRAGDRVSFSGRFVEHGEAFADEIGVDETEGAALLVAQRGHIEVAARDVTISQG